jgi:hypothetical protein
MAELFSKVTLALSANEKEGRFIVKYYEWPINRDTGKTIIVTKHHGDHKFLKNEILKVKPVRRNDKFAEIGFSTVCYSKDLVEAEGMLREVANKKLKELIDLQMKVLQAWKDGCKIQKVK